MAAKTKVIYIFWTCRNKKEAKQIVHGLLDQRLIACASLLPEIESIYRWEGKIEESREIKVILKTQQKCFDAIQKYIESLCSYAIAEILQVDVARGNPAYLAWISHEISPYEIT